MDVAMHPSPPGLRLLMLVAMSLGVIFVVSFLFWLTNAADTRPLHNRLRMLFVNLTGNLFVAKFDYGRIVADDEDDASRGEPAQEFPECLA